MTSTIRAAALVLMAVVVLAGCRHDPPAAPGKRWPVVAEAGGPQLQSSPR
ncbi:hypothetical protein MUY14_00870 [Amycolatopsis sp. FBCC-B4732]|nr:hypothetical protein [Amycolatopsis sp. FBCC-B4732]UOX89230.1 hypothetical protein MUY14_00870 [Amycolatopsis sp. FBCC-B4732]